jgi:hypothetical protein
MSEDVKTAEEIAQRLYSYGTFCRINQWHH